MSFRFFPFNTSRFWLCFHSAVTSLVHILLFSKPELPSHPPNCSFLVPAPPHFNPFYTSVPDNFCKPSFQNALYPVIVSYSCLTMFHKLGGLKNNRNLFFPCLQAGCLKSRLPAGWYSLWRLYKGWGDPSSPLLSFWRLLAILAFLGLQKHLSNLCFYHHIMFSPHVWAQISFFLIRTPIILYFGPTLIQYDFYLHLTWFYLQKS